MSRQILRDGFYIQQTNFLGVSGTTGYQLVYYSDTGDYEIRQQGAAKGTAGYLLVVAPATLMKNGSFTSDAVQIPELFIDGNPNNPTEKAKKLLLDANNIVYKDGYLGLGGPNKGNKINPAALPANQGTFKVYNAAAGTSAGIASIIGGPLALPPGQGNPFLGALNIPEKQFESANMGRLYPSNLLLKYPMDIIEHKQDILQITQYEYKAPYRDIFESKQTTKDLFLKGAQRQSALKAKLATVILPIPNNVSDSNQVNWGDGDQTNTFSMAAASQMPKVVAGQLISDAAGQLGELTGKKAISDALGDEKAKNAIAVALLGGLTNPSSGAAIQSILLKRAGFDISPETILSRGYGVVANSNLELLFSGPMLRGFQFGYILSPRSENEAIMCRKIIRFFKQGMAAKKSNTSGGGAGASSFLLSTPNVFKLQYKTFGKDGNQKDIAGLNKFKICALTNIQTSYADGQWAAFDEGQPVRYQINLQFKELEPIYESDYQDKLSGSLNGTIKDENDDQPRVFDDEIGF